MSSPPYRTPAPCAPPSAEAKLGALRSSHTPRPISRRPIALVILIAVCLLPAVIVLQLANRGILDVPWVFVPFVLLALLLGASLLRNRDIRVDLHEHGVIVLRKGVPEVVLFEDVDELWLEQQRAHFYAGSFAQITALRLIDHDGTKHHVPLAVDDGLKILRWVLRHCSDPLLPDARAAIAAGEPLTFGKIRIDRDGVTIGKRAARWQDFRFVRSQLGSLSFFGRLPLIPWATVDLATIPHPTVFGRIVAEHAPRIEHDYPFEISS